jgi:hypothetical protein
MRPILDVFSKTWFVNIILAVCVAFFGIKSIRVWSDGEHVKTSPVAVQKTKKWSVKKIGNKKMPPEATYAVVTDKDLFIPDRAELVEAEKTASTAKPDPAPKSVAEDIRIAGRKIVLYGVVIMPDYKTALIRDPKSKNSQRPSMWVKEGDAIGAAGQVVVAGIQKEGITLMKDKKVYQIPLYDKGKPRGKVAAQKKQGKPTVVETKPAATSISKNKTTAVSKSSNETKSSKENKGSKSKEGEFKTVDTPFGKIKLRKE